MATHAETEARIVPEKELVIVGPHLWPPRYAGETPAIELPSKGSELGCLEVLGEHLSRKLFLLVNDERTAMGQPRNGIRVLFV